MSIKAGLISLGCAKNQVDSELMLGILSENGVEITAKEEDADVIIINTCGFIEQAKTEAIENILEIIELKKEGIVKGIIVTGCLSERYKNEIEKEFPEVSAFLGTGSYNKIYETVKSVYNGEKYVAFDEKESHIIEGKRILISPPYTAYIKISEGCDNCCSYCAIPLIRGRFRSRKTESIISEAKLLTQNGVKEICITAQDTTRYGLDLYGEYKLAHLLNELCKINGLEWIRVLYLYPDKITDELLEVIAQNKKIVNYIDMPVQHASGRILKLMNRQGDKKSLLAIIKKIREKIPGVVLRTTVMTGFPQESEKDFEELAAFIKEAQFERLGAFCYSSEEGTKAASLSGQIDEETKQKRYENIMQEQYLIMQKHNEEQINKTLDTLVEGYDRYIKCYFGRSYMDAPDIDGKVFFKSEKRLSAGECAKVRITNISDYDLLGEIIQNEA